MIKQNTSQKINKLISKRDALTENIKAVASTAITENLDRIDVIDLERISLNEEIASIEQLIHNL